jgi:hypothetical protein
MIPNNIAITFARKVDYKTVSFAQNADGSWNNSVLELCTAKKLDIIIG